MIFYGIDHVGLFVDITAHLATSIDLSLVDVDPVYFGLLFFNKMHFTYNLVDLSWI